MVIGLSFQDKIARPYPLFHSNCGNLWIPMPPV